MRPRTGKSQGEGHQVFSRTEYTWVMFFFFRNVYASALVILSLDDFSNKRPQNENLVVFLSQACLLEGKLLVGKEISIAPRNSQAG